MSNSRQNEKNRTEPSTLYLVATPIGNLDDISARALKVLSEVDFIAAEDTRNTAKLLSFFEIKKPLVSYHEHNKAQRGPEIVAKLSEGQSCALVSDAGMPAISDPGEDLVRLCHNANIKVSCIPGASAVVTAVALSGLSSRRFVFEGFLEGKASEQRKRLEEIAHEKRTLVIYEAPHNIDATLKLIYDVFGDRRITLCRELTKINEEITRSTLCEASKLYEIEKPRGEFVLVIEGATESNDGAFWKELDIKAHVDYYINCGLSKMDAIKQTAKDRGVSKNEIYKQVAVK